MKLTKKQLKQIIKEELSDVLGQAEAGDVEGDDPYLDWAARDHQRCEDLEMEYFSTLDEIKNYDWRGDYSVNRRRSTDFKASMEMQTRLNAALDNGVENGCQWALDRQAKNALRSHTPSELMDIEAGGDVEKY